MTAPGASSNGRVSFAWVAGVLVTLLTLLGGALLSDLRSDLAEVQRNQNVRNEAQATIRAEVNSLTASLKRIEDKLDKLLEGGRR